MRRRVRAPQAVGSRCAATGTVCSTYAAPPSVRVRGVTRPAAAAALGWVAASGVGGGCIWRPNSEATAAEAGAIPAEEREEEGAVCAVEEVEAEAEALAAAAALADSSL